MSKKFPDGFFWGAATSSYQIEGGIENCDWAHAAREGKVPPAGIACDHYNRFEEDLDIAQSLGLTSFRFSIEWSRIEPEEGKFNLHELDHYKKVVDAIRVRGMEPFVTLWHFTLPLWFVKKGGFMHQDAPDIFARYAQKVVSHFGEEVTFYSTMNEPMVWIGNGHVAGIWPPFKKNVLNFFILPTRLVLVHKKAYTTIKECCASAHIGITKNNIVFEDTVLTWFLNASSFLEWFWDKRFYQAIKYHQDFIGMNHYFRVVLGNTKSLKDSLHSDFGWELRPETLYKALKEVKKYNIPVYVMEHGLADAKDTRRAWFITESLKWLHQGIEEGVDVRGYMHWSLLDNFEWAEGFDMRFGLVHIDYNNNQKRTIRESAKAYAEICKNNAI